MKAMINLEQIDEYIQFHYHLSVWRLRCSELQWAHFVSLSCHLENHTQHENSDKARVWRVSVQNTHSAQYVAKLQAWSVRSS